MPGMRETNPAPEPGHRIRPEIGEAGIVEDTWGKRDVPVLKAAVALLEQSYMVTVSDIAEQTGLELADVARSLDAMDPTYVDFRKTETGGDPRFWYVHKVTPEARQQVGQWPTPESLVDRLRMTSRLLSDSVRAAAIDVVAGVIGGGDRIESETT